MLSVFHKDNGIDFTFKWLSFNTVNDIFKVDPIAANNWQKVDTKVYKYSQSDYFKFKEIENNIDSLIFYSDHTSGEIGLKKIVTPYVDSLEFYYPDDLGAGVVFTQAEINEFIADKASIDSWLATNPPDASTIPATTTPYIDTIKGSIIGKEYHNVTNEVTQVVVSIIGTLVDLNTELKVAP